MPSPYNNRPSPTSVALFRQLREERELSGVIKRIVFTSEDGHFVIARFIPEGEQDFISISGNMPGVSPGEPMLITGGWKHHEKHGPTFEVTHYVPVVPRDPEMLKAYLGSGLVKGVGPVKAARIVEHFGGETVDVLDSAPERLREVKGLEKGLAEAVSKAWTEHRANHEVMMFLATNGVSPALSRRLFKHYGPEAAGIMRSNPYRAGMEVSGIGFHTADRIASGMGIAKDSDERIRAGLLHVLQDAAGDGHTYLSREGLLEKALELLDLPSERVTSVFTTEVESRRRIREEELPDQQRGVFMRSLYTSESGCARMLAALLHDAKPLVKRGVAEKLKAFEERFRFQLAPQQREAVHAIAQGGVSVVTGGPGTGKTTLVRALLHVLKEEDFKILLCSPTGRAAQRLGETTGWDASTIHRLLKYNAQLHKFAHGPDQPLNAQLVIVDESSMLDIPLAYHLLRALKPGTAVVFVGDVDQLPSVGAGNFLHDLIRSGRVPTTRLDVIFRQAQQSAIIVNSHRINKGEMPQQAEKTAGGHEPDFYFIEREEPEQIRQALVEMACTRIPKKFGFDPISDVQVLTPMRRGPIGTNELNLLLQEKLNGGGALVNVAGLHLRAGDKVIQIQNNYDLEVFNGDVGRVASISRESMTLRVVFGKRPVEYRWEEADQLSLAYAVTIHKSQGSEYPAVVVITHTSQFVMLKRNLLYTGVTRGKKLVVMIGNKRAVRMAVQNVNESERLSALWQWLSRPPAGADLAGGEDVALEGM